jgi:hypothetical protein
MLTYSFHRDLLAAATALLAAPDDPERRATLARAVTEATEAALPTAEKLAAIAEANWKVLNGDRLEPDELEIDIHPAYSEADEGIWVSAWIWVPRNRIENKPAPSAQELAKLRADARALITGEPARPDQG